MNRMTICAAVATAMTLSVCSAASAGIIGAYDWVAYDSLTAFIGTTNPLGDFDASYVPAGNITDYTIDTDRSAYTTSGELIDYGTGAATGVTMEVVWSGNGQLFIEKSNNVLTPGPVEFDVLSPNYKGKLVLHGTTGQTDRSQTIVFTDLDPDCEYEFYGIAEGGSSYYDSYAIIDLLSTDAVTNESTLTSVASINTLAGFGVNTPSQSFLGYATDDLMKFTGIRPGADGTFSVRATSAVFGHRGHSPGFDAIALAKVTGAEGPVIPPVNPPDGSAVPEPSSQAMAMMAALGLLACGLYRWRRTKM